MLILLIYGSHLGIAQQSTAQSYVKKIYMIPMRDGVKLNTVVYSPVGPHSSLPLLIKRTPYGADKPDSHDQFKDPYTALMAKEGYIFVFQDMRGRFKSEGIFEMNRPIYHVWDKKKPMKVHPTTWQDRWLRSGGMPE